ncbi:MAG: sugar transferase [Thioalkalivibrio sp.]|nr:sugar transferase [Thioalkalivibrio sp.]
MTDRVRPDSGALDRVADDPRGRFVCGDVPERAGLSVSVAELIDMPPAEDEVSEMTIYREVEERPPYERGSRGAAPRGARQGSAVPREQLTVKGHPADKVPWTALADGAGLMIALTAVVVRLGLDDPQGRLFFAAITASSLYVWLLSAQFRSLKTILRRRRADVYAVPLLAAGSTTAVLLIGGVELPWPELGLYVAVWTGALLIGRLAIARNQAPLRVLLIGSPAFRSDLEGRQDVEVVSLDEPPERVKGWDVVATDPSRSYDREWLQWISHADMHDVKVMSAPLLLETLTSRVPTEMLHGRWAFEVLSARSRYRFWKRFLDVVSVILAAPVLLSLAGVTALIVAVESGRPLLFFQERVGLGGRTFRMIKFRTMVKHAEVNGSAFATQDDPRITRVGTFLRQYRLDEIPQFWNVLWGEMSIIGPRPEQLSFAEQFDDEIPLYQLRHNVRPGITGWAQVRQGYAANTIETETKLRYDFFYVKHCSLGLDAVIVWRTILTILTGFGSR